MSLPGLKIDETDDEFFGTLESRSNLANLFDVNQASGDSNQSLKYKPPKQVQAQAPTEGGSEASAVAWTVVVAKVVRAFKLVSQENISQGRLGLALLKNSQNSFKVILYRAKNNVLATTTLQSGVKLILKSSYLQFHDDTQQFWSVLLETSDEQSFLDHLPADYISNIEETKPTPSTSKQFEPDPEVFTDDSDTASKAKLLSRMAKMGKPLPKLATPQTTTDLSDSSDTEVITIPPKPNVVPRKVSKQLVPVGNVVPSTSVASCPQPIQDSQYMSMLLTENRIQNTELRINLSKLETKIEKVLDTIVNIGSTTEPEQKIETDKEEDIIELEEKVVELRRDNRALRQTIRELQIKRALPPEPVLKASRFVEYEDVLAELEISVEDCEDLEDLAMDVLDNSRTRLDKLRAEIKQGNSNLRDCRIEIGKLNGQIVDLKSQLKDTNILQANMKNLSKDKEELSHQLDLVEANAKEKLQTIVKQIMNNLYGEIVTSLETTTGPLTKETVMRICGNAIRKETMNAIQGNTT